MYVCVSHVSLTWWMLGIQPVCTGRAESEFNRRVISPAPSLTFLIKASFIFLEINLETLFYFNLGLTCQKSTIVHNVKL